MAFGGHMASNKRPKTILKFKKASEWWGALWRGGLPVGNGKIGASVFGGAGKETILINHGDLWWQGYTGVLQDVADKLKDLRRATDEGDYTRAAEILPNALINKGYRPIPAVPLPLCDLKVSMPLEKPVKEYSRILNLETGEAIVSFRDGSTKYDRSLFVSMTSNIIAYEFTKTGPKGIEAVFSFDIHDRSNIRTPQAISKLPEGLMTKYENFFMYISARSDNGTEFGAVARITHYGGSMEVKNNSIRIKGAERIFVLVKPFIESQREKEWKALKAELSAIKLTYERMFKDHCSAFSKLFSSAEFDLEAEDRDEYIEDLIEAAQAGEIKEALIEKLWAFGRYLFISSTSPDSRIMAPYGLWCGDYKAVNSYINAYRLPFVYYQAFTGGLSSYLMPIFDYYEQMIDDLKKNASRLYGCRGIFIPEVVAPQSGLLGIIDPKIIHNVSIGGMIANLYYEYYLYTGDIKFLKDRALPFMKEVTLFYEEFLKIKADGKYDCNPSYAPDGLPGNISSENDIGIARNSTMDFAVLKELLINIIEGSQKANTNKDEIPKWEDMLTRIPAYVINSEGLVKEYIETRILDNHDSRSFGLFYPIFPGNEKLDSERFNAFYNTAQKRLHSGINKHNSISYSVLANVFAKMGNASDVMECLEFILRTSMMSNFVCASNDWRGMGIGDDDFWATYCPESNILLTSAISECMVTSTEDSIVLLPALNENFKKGSIEGFQTRCGAEVGIEWDRKKGIINAKIKSRRAITFDLILPKETKRLKGLDNHNYDPETHIVKDITLPANKMLNIEIRI